MFGKLLLIVVCCGLTAAVLLVLRQQRVEAAHEMSALHQHMLANERSLWSLRADIAHRCRPEEIRRLMEPMPFEWITKVETTLPASGTAKPPAGPEPVTSTVAAGDEEAFGG